MFSVVPEASRCFGGAGAVLGQSSRRARPGWRRESSSAAESARGTRAASAERINGEPAGSVRRRDRVLTLSAERSEVGAAATRTNCLIGVILIVLLAVTLLPAAGLAPAFADEPAQRPAVTGGDVALEGGTDAGTVAGQARDDGMIAAGALVYTVADGGLMLVGFDSADIAEEIVIPASVLVDGTETPVVAIDIAEGNVAESALSLTLPQSINDIDTSTLATAFPNLATVEIASVGSASAPVAAGAAAMRAAYSSFGGVLYKNIPVAAEGDASQATLTKELIWAPPTTVVARIPVECVSIAPGAFADVKDLKTVVCFGVMESIAQTQKAEDGTVTPGAFTDEQIQTVNVIVPQTGTVVPDSDSERVSADVAVTDDSTMDIKRSAWWQSGFASDRITLGEVYGSTTSTLPVTEEGTLEVAEAEVAYAPETTQNSSSRKAGIEPPESAIPTPVPDDDQIDPSESGLVFTHLADMTLSVSWKGDPTATPSHIDIPAYATINGVVYPVTEIAPHAFEGAVFLTSVTIPEGVSKIGEDAFEGCTSLSEANLLPVSKGAVDAVSADASMPPALPEGNGTNHPTLAQSVSSVDKNGTYGESAIDLIESYADNDSVQTETTLLFSFPEGSVLGISSWEGEDIPNFIESRPNTSASIKEYTLWLIFLSKYLDRLSVQLTYERSDSLYLDGWFEDDEKIALHLKIELAPGYALTGASLVGSFQNRMGTSGKWNIPQEVGHNPMISLSVAKTQEDVIAQHTTDIAALKTAVGGSTGGLIKDAADLWGVVGKSDSAGLRKRVKDLEGKTHLALGTTSTTAAAGDHKHDAADITGGTLAAARIPDLSASKITSGTMSGDRISSLAAGKLTGTIDAARLPASAVTTANKATTLSEYATQTWVEGRGYLTGASLNGYAKTADVDTKLSGYVTTTALGTTLSGYVTNQTAADTYATKQTVNSLTNTVNAKADSNVLSSTANKYTPANTVETAIADAKKAGTDAAGAVASAKADLEGRISALDGAAVKASEFGRIVKYDYAGGGPGGAVMPTAYRKGGTPALPAPERDGWEFVGWSWSRGGASGTSADLADAFAEAGDVALTANWEEAGAPEANYFFTDARSYKGGADAHEIFVAIADAKKRDRVEVSFAKDAESGFVAGASGITFTVTGADKERPVAGVRFADEGGTSATVELAQAGGSGPWGVFVKVDVPEGAIDLSGRPSSLVDASYVARFCKMSYAYVS